MSTSSGASPPGDWWARPRVVLPILACLLVLVVLLTPEPATGRSGDDRLSAHVGGMLGARALADAAARFGWHTALRDSIAAPALPAGTTVHAVLDPPIPPTAADAHRVLEAVRQGDAMLFVVGRRNALSDSLGVRHTRLGGVLVPGVADTAGCGGRPRDFMPGLWPDGRVHAYGLQWLRGSPPDLVALASVSAAASSTSGRSELAVAGYPFGRGRVAVVSDPDLLRNDVLRRCGWGADVLAIRTLEWLRAGGAQPRTRLEFDEYHQGFGRRLTSGAVTRRFLIGHPAGRTILAAVLAALVLLLAAAPRPLPPRASLRAERRDPLEQADALARAYEQVGATRTATERLLRGVRSRVDRGSARRGGAADRAFVEQVGAAMPARASDVALVLRGLAATRAAPPLGDIGAALQRIEDALTITPGRA